MIGTSAIALLLLLTVNVHVHGFLSECSNDNECGGKDQWCRMNAYYSSYGMCVTYRKLGEYCHGGTYPLACAPGLHCKYPRRYHFGRVDNECVKDDPPTNQADHGKNKVTIGIRN